MTLDELVAKLESSDEALYQPIEHPRLLDKPVVQPCAERLEMIRLKLLPMSAGRLLDIGCHTGWFSRAFARRGWSVLGIDRSQDWLSMAKTLNALLDASVVPPTYRCEDVQHWPLWPSVDVALCLSVAMYLFEDEARGWSTFLQLSRAANKMFMDIGGMYADRLPFDSTDTAEVIGEVLDHTHYTHGQLLGYTDFENRPLFYFE